MAENLHVTSSEHKKTSQIAFLLDVDGVITNPSEKKVTEPQIFDFLEQHLINNNPVTLNTGRSNEWMVERVINPLSERVQDKSILKNFFAVGEKGLTWASFNAEGELLQGVFDRDGRRVEGFDLGAFLEPRTVEHFKILGEESKKLINRKYSHSTFFDTTKKAMVSTEMKDGYNQPEFAREQQAFTQELQVMLEKLGLEGKFKIDPTTIATDIQVPQAGKHLGTKRILGRLAAQKIAPKHFIAVGDSASDLEMADELYSQGKSVEFYYVQPQKALNVTKSYPVIYTAQQFGKGTVEMFQNIIE